MQENQNINSKRNTADDEIDLIALLVQLWNGRFLIIKITSIFLVLGIVYALLTPNTYEAKSVFVAQELNGGASRSFGGLASLAGINLGGSEGRGMSPVLYPKIINSTPFKREMLNAKILYGDDYISYRDYLMQKPTPILSYVKKYTLGLPSVIFNSLKSGKKGRIDGDVQDSLKIDNEEFQLLKSIDAIISLEINDREGYMTLLLLDNEPNIAAQMALWAQENLQQKVIKFKLQNTRELYKYASEQFLKKREELYLIQDSLANFKDQNQNINSAFVENQRLRMEAKVSMLTSVYSELASQKEQAALQLKKDMPIFSIIDPVKEPNVKKGPKRAFILVIFIVLGLVIPVGYILGLQLFKSIFSKIQLEATK
ncbi:Wzz/FepE/Etk N-terminal domain-containing protein [Roseivirga seohaensis]|uniref:Wzz/FepE/Etk N-terminal domain-containing protein n=1 Tax=Roseivirga seohaensis TaxID=1914963 RepID=UPI003BAC1154